MGYVFGVCVWLFSIVLEKYSWFLKKKIYKLIYGDVYTVVCLRLVWTLKKTNSVSLWGCV